VMVAIEEWRPIREGTHWDGTSTNGCILRLPGWLCLQLRPQ
jgi:hypothetical protein